MDVLDGVKDALHVFLADRLVEVTERLGVRDVNLAIVIRFTNQRNLTTPALTSKNVTGSVEAGGDDVAPGAVHVGPIRDVDLASSPLEHDMRHGLLRDFRVRELCQEHLVDAACELTTIAGRQR